MLLFQEIQSQDTSLNAVHESGIFVGLLVLLPLVALIVICIESTRTPPPRQTSARPPSASMRTEGMGDEDSTKSTKENSYKQHRKPYGDGDNRTMGGDGRPAYFAYEQETTFLQKMAGCCPFGRDIPPKKRSFIFTPSMPSLRDEYEIIVEKLAIKRVPLALTATEEDLQERLSEAYFPPSATDTSSVTKNGQKSGKGSDARSTIASELQAPITEKRSQVAFSSYYAAVPQGSKQHSSSITSEREIASILPVGTVPKTSNKSLSYYAMVPSADKPLSTFPVLEKPPPSATESPELLEELKELQQSFTVIVPPSPEASHRKDASLLPRHEEPHEPVIKKVSQSYFGVDPTSEPVVSEYELASTSVQPVDGVPVGIKHQLYQSSMPPGTGTTSKSQASYFAFIPKDNVLNNKSGLDSITPTGSSSSSESHEDTTRPLALPENTQVTSYLAYIPHSIVTDNKPGPNEKYPASKLYSERYKDDTQLLPENTQVPSYFAHIPQTNITDNKRGQKEKSLADSYTPDPYPEVHSDNLHSFPKEREEMPKSQVVSYFAYIPQNTITENKPELKDNSSADSYSPTPTPEDSERYSDNFPAARECTPNSQVASYYAYIPQSTITDTKPEANSHSPYPAPELHSNRHKEELHQFPAATETPPKSEVPSCFAYVPRDTFTDKKLGLTEKHKDNLQSLTSAPDSTPELQSYFALIPPNSGTSRKHKTKSKVPPESYFPSQSQGIAVDKTHLIQRPEKKKSHSRLSSAPSDTEPQLPLIRSSADTYYAMVPSVLQPGQEHPVTKSTSRSSLSSEYVTIHRQPSTTVFPADQIRTSFHSTSPGLLLASRPSNKSLKHRKESDLLDDDDDDKIPLTSTQQPVSYVEFRKGGDEAGKKQLTPEYLNQFVSILIDSNYKDPIPKDPLTTSSTILDQVPPQANTMTLQESISAIGASQRPTTPQVNVRGQKTQSGQATQDTCGVASQFRKSSSSHHTQTSSKQVPDTDHTSKVSSDRRPTPRSRTSRSISPSQISSRPNRPQCSNEVSAELGCEKLSGYSKITQSRPSPSVNLQYVGTTLRQRTRSESIPGPSTDSLSSTYTEHTVQSKIEKTSICYPCSNHPGLASSIHDSKPERSDANNDCSICPSYPSSSRYITNYKSQSMPEHVHVDGQHADQCSMCNSFLLSPSMEASKQSVPETSFVHTSKTKPINQMNLPVPIVDRTGQDGRPSSHSARSRTSRTERIHSRIPSVELGCSTVVDLASDFNTKSRSSKPEQIYQNIHSEEMGCEIFQKKAGPRKYMKPDNQSEKIHANRHSDEIGCDVLQNLSHNQAGPMKYMKITSQPEKVHKDRQSEEIGCEILQNYRQMSRPIKPATRTISKESQAQLISNRPRKREDIPDHTTNMCQQNQSPQQIRNQESNKPDNSNYVDRHPSFSENSRARRSPDVKPLKNEQTKKTGHHQSFSPVTSEKLQHLHDYDTVEKSYSMLKRDHSPLAYTAHVPLQSSLPLPEKTSKKYKLERTSSEILQNVRTEQQVHSIMSPNHLGMDSSSRNSNLPTQSNSLQDDTKEETIKSHTVKSEQSINYKDISMPTHFTDEEHENSIQRSSTSFQGPQSDESVIQSDDASSQSSSPHIPDASKAEYASSSTTSLNGQQQSEAQQDSTRGTMLRWKIIIKHHRDPVDDQPPSKRPRALAMLSDSQSGDNAATDDQFSLNKSMESSRKHRARSRSSSTDSQREDK